MDRKQHRTFVSTNASKRPPSEPSAPMDEQGSASPKFTRVTVCFSHVSSESFAPGHLNYQQKANAVCTAGRQEPQSPRGLARAIGARGL